mgnify:CR=1 FL=1
MYRNKKRFRESGRAVACNHLENNNVLVTKHGLYRLMKAYCAGEGREPMGRFMPLTFHVTTLEDEEWTSFKAAFMKHTQDEDETRATNLWILKPAMMSNRGFGIRVSNDLDEIDGPVYRGGIMPAGAPLGGPPAASGGAWPGCPGWPET